jgi:HEPN domain-containing protein
MGQPMSLPANQYARPFYRAAKQRLDEAVFLLESRRTTAAVYLAGYGIECMLKALLLSTVSASKSAELVLDFRGQKAHSYDWLREQVVELTGRQCPREVMRHFRQVNLWSTNLRYETNQIKYADANTFLSSVIQIVHWIDERI